MPDALSADLSAPENRFDRESRAFFDKPYHWAKNLRDALVLVPGLSPYNTK